MLSRRRQRHAILDIWPGFVDALATLLIVIIFVLMTFIVSQFSLTDALQGRDQALGHLTEKLNTLSQALNLEKEIHEETKKKNQNLEESLKVFQEQINFLKMTLGKIETDKEIVLGQNQSLLSQLNTLNEHLTHLKQNITVLEEEKAITKEKFEGSLSEKLKELAQIQGELKKTKISYNNLSKETKKTTSLKQIGQYQSEFFERLQQIIGERSEIRIVGDRFVFQSEVLFDLASAELGVEGKQKLDQLIKALKEIADKIPKDLNWILRVDGHTDRLPIKTPQFPSNWQLSSARAISVVKYMIEKGIQAHHLVAAGFGEHQPLDAETNRKGLAKNRRIEFKLDQR